MAVVFSAMNKSIIDYINSKIPKDKNHAVTGTFYADYVLIGNRKFEADLVSDISYSNGDTVYCLLPDSGYKAAVVGK